MSQQKFLTWLPWQLGMKKMPGVLLQVLKTLFFFLVTNFTKYELKKFPISRKIS
jgi:hypothetical protein